MSEAARLFPALKRANVVPAALLENSNPLAYYFLERWKRQAESLLALLPTVEAKRKPKQTEFHYLDGTGFSASCIDYKNTFYIGFSLSAALRVFDLYLHIVNREKYLKGTLPTGLANADSSKSFSPLMYNEHTLLEFPRSAPLSDAHLESAIRLSFLALKFILFHELTHLWDGHGPYKLWRERNGHPLTKIELRSLEWLADRLSISRMMLIYRAGEHAIPLAKALASALDGPHGEALFQGTIANPRTYIRHIVFTLLIFFWHFDEKTDQYYIDKAHPYHSARAFYFLSELGRVVTHWVYEPWSISLNEYMLELSGPSLVDAMACWDEMTGQSQGSENMQSAIHQPYALRDLKRFESVATCLELDIQKNRFCI